MKISLIIVSYNNLEVLIDCLESIYKNKPQHLNVEVIVVDNTPNTRIFDYISSKYTEIILIKNQNKGFGEGNNVGARASSGEYLIFLNPDTVLLDNIFDFTIDKFENDQCLGLFGVKLVDSQLKTNSSFFIMDSTSILTIFLNKLCNVFNIYIHNKMFICGANIFIRRSTFFEAGLFDEKIFLYHEEPDLHRRVNHLGYKTAFYSDHKIIHLEGKTTEVSSEKDLIVYSRWLESYKYYCEKFGISFESKIKEEIRATKIKLGIYKILSREKFIKVTKRLDLLIKYL